MRIAKGHRAAAAKKNKHEKPRPPSEGPLFASSEQAKATVRVESWRFREGDRIHRIGTEFEGMILDTRFGIHKNISCEGREGAKESTGSRELRPYFESDARYWMHDTGFWNTKCGMRDPPRGNEFTDFDRI
jgi:hypothetical protein